MAGWSIHTGEAVALNLDNIDTDQLIPARFMSRPRSEGYGDYLLYDLRRSEAGALRADFALNAHTGASILVAGRNFGSGSSREAAVYALLDAGFVAVVAPSFGDIFANNAINNGLLPAQLIAEDVADLATRLATDLKPMRIDVEAQTLSLSERAFLFSLEEASKRKIINGWDDIDLTLDQRDEIAAFRTTKRATMPWALVDAMGQEG